MRKLQVLLLILPVVALLASSDAPRAKPKYTNTLHLIFCQGKYNSCVDNCDQTWVPGKFHDRCTSSCNIGLINCQAEADVQGGVNPGQAKPVEAPPPIPGPKPTKGGPPTAAPIVTGKPIGASPTPTNTPVILERNSGHKRH